MSNHDMNTGRFTQGNQAGQGRPKGAKNIPHKELGKAITHIEDNAEEIANTLVFNAVNNGNIDACKNALELLIAFYTMKNASKA